LFGLRQDRGTIEIPTFGPGGSFPENAELYLTRADYRYGRYAPTFKVSNSVTLGAMPTRTRARNWTAEETARYTKEPPTHSPPIRPPHARPNTAVAGTAIGGSLRYVEPNGHLLGVEYQLGGEKSLGRLVPIFRRDQESTLPNRVLARDGYAVGGVEVKS